MKYVKGIALLISLYIITLGLIYIDIEDSRPIISLFKNLQSDSSLEVVDFSVDKEEIKSSKPAPNKDRNAYYGDLHVHTKYSFDAVSYTHLTLPTKRIV